MMTSPDQLDQEAGISIDDQSDQDSRLGMVGRLQMTGRKCATSSSPLGPGSWSSDQ